MLTHVDDVISGIILAMKSKRAENETYIICGDDSKTYEDWIRLGCIHAKRVQPFIKLPFPVVRSTVKLIKPMLNIFFKTVFLYHEKTVDQMILDRKYSNRKAFQHFGYKPQYTIEAGVKNFLETCYENKEMSKFKISPVSIIIGLLILLLLYIFL